MTGANIGAWSTRRAATGPPQIRPTGFPSISRRRLINDEVLSGRIPPITSLPPYTDDPLFSMTKSPHIEGSSLTGRALTG